MIRSLQLKLLEASVVSNKSVEAEHAEWWISATLWQMDCRWFCATSGYSTQSIYCSVYNIDFHRDSAIVLTPCLQNYSNVPGSKLKWHHVVAHNNIFRSCVKHVTEQRCHIAQDNLRTGRPHVEKNRVQLLSSLLDADRRWTVRELAAEVDVCHKTVL